MSKSCATSHPSHLHSSLSLRSRKFFRIWNVPPDPSTLNGEKSVPSIEVQGEIVNTQWSNNGAIFAVTFQDQGLVLYTLDDETSSNSEKPELRPFPLPLPEQLQNLPTKQLKWIVFSPQGTYLCTFWIPSGLGLTELTGPNYYIWRINRSEQGAIIGANIVFSDTYKTLSSPGPMQWRDDEQVRVFTRNGALQIYAGHDFEKPALASLSLAPKFSISIAPYCVSEPDAVSITMFAPASQAGDTPGEVRLLLCKITQSEKDSAGVWHTRGVVPVKIGVKELSGVDGCEFLWSPSGRICMMMTSTLVDAAGDNYGSVGDLWLCDLNVARKKGQEDEDGSGEDERLTSLKENMGMQQSGSPVDIEYLKIKKINERVTQDAKWSPTADEFVLIEGKAPSDIYLYDGVTGERVHRFAKGYKNQIVWNRQGDMVAIGGFGNLAGDLSFYYRDANRQVILINEWREACTVLCDWSPCGNYFFTASVRPRMNVDNQIKLWSREGAQLLHIPFDELNGVEWKQAPDIDFPFPSAPKPAERMQNKTTYRPRNWANSSADSQLLTRFYNGEITESDLPEEVRKRITTRSNRNNGARGYNEKGRYGATDKACDTAMDWRSSEPVSEEKKEASEGAQSDLVVGSTSSVPATSQPPASGTAIKTDNVPRRNGQGDEQAPAVAATKKEAASRKTRKEANRNQQTQQSQTQSGTVSAPGTKRSPGSVANASTKGGLVAGLTDPCPADQNEFSRKSVGTTQAIENNGRVLIPTNVDTQKDGGAGPPSGVTPPKKELVCKQDTAIPQVPVTLPSSVQSLPKNPPSGAKYGGITSVEPTSSLPAVQIPPQYSAPQPVVQASSKPVASAPESMLSSYLPHPFSLYGGSGNPGTDRIAVEAMAPGTASGVYSKWDPRSDQSARDVKQVSKVGNVFLPQSMASFNSTSNATGVIGKDTSGRIPPSYNSGVSMLQHRQPQSYDNVVMDPRASPLVEKTSVPPPLQQPSQQASPALSDNSILSLLQSILPSHAKLHVRAEPEGVAAPPSVSVAPSAGNTMTSGGGGGGASGVAESNSAFFRYFDNPTQNASSPYAFRPPSKVTARTPSQPLPQSYTNVSPLPPPAFPNPQPKEELTDKERDLEQARFIALIEQAGLKLPNLTFTGNRQPAPAPSAAASAAPGPYLNPSTNQPRQRRWQQGQAPLQPQGATMNIHQQTTKPRSTVSVNEQSWPSLQDVFATNKPVATSQSNWGPKQSMDAKRGGLPYAMGGSSMPAPMVAQRYEEHSGSSDRGMLTSETGAPKMDANLRELLKSLQSQQQQSQQNSAEYAVKELLQQSGVNASSAQSYLDPHQGDAASSAADSRKRTQAGWQQTMTNMRRIQQQPSSSPHDGEVKYKSVYENMSGGGNRRVWQYVDPKGIVQGPFSRREMRAWWEKGYFAGDLPVRCDMQEDFVPLQNMFPGGEKVFTEE